MLVTYGHPNSPLLGPNSITMPGRRAWERQRNINFASIKRWISLWQRRIQVWEAASEDIHASLLLLGCCAKSAKCWKPCELMMGHLIVSVWTWPDLFYHSLGSSWLTRLLRWFYHRWTRQEIEIDHLGLFLSNSSSSQFPSFPYTCALFFPSDRLLAISLAVWLVVSLDHDWFFRPPGIEPVLTLWMTHVSVQ